ncbi:MULTISPECIES: protein phosphatase 2C domain-containing protein [unclassified Parafrankia]|uniref:protein phosphatase 2C domain-containing protein n=1 Tax=unclassified Parafrankia TaxID=2994368 RepID=UPI000DA48B98|nr:MULTISPECIES: protein phosphatase 2C domain-containing protein [unclassified Parafrankia]TCJ33108.1 serine/threonine-protein phosphatase [Parafrankia sp. BMG5.11]SQD93857.1 Protein serine/threonine phosphatase [Parafrankia sp. Ea1.12]
MSGRPAGPLPRPEEQTPVTTPPACPRCAATPLAGDRYCERCGAALTATAASGTGPASRTAAAMHAVLVADVDRYETDLGAAAGVSDRGLVHHSNEDGMGVALAADSSVGAVGLGAVGVVCDGVSSARGSGPAAAAAAAAATALLTDRVEAWRSRAVPVPAGGPGPGLAPQQAYLGGGRAGGAATPEAERDTAGEMAAALRDAARAAQNAAVAGAAGLGLSPACTFVGTVVVDATLVVGWLGDSRAYLVDSSGARRLTEDDTVAAEAVRAGRLAPELAERGRDAHTITRWLGVGSASAIPRIRAVALPSAGRIVLCSDGLWNYASAAETLAGHVDALGPGAPAIDVARHLVEVALRGGGSDNVTAIVIDIPGRT